MINKDLVMIDKGLVRQNDNSRNYTPARSQDYIKTTMVMTCE